VRFALRDGYVGGKRKKSSVIAGLVTRAVAVECSAVAASPRFPEIIAGFPFTGTSAGLFSLGRSTS
jgi:hypothetical protein